MKSSLVDFSYTLSPLTANLSLPLQVLRDLSSKIELKLVFKPKEGGQEEVPRVKSTVTVQNWLLVADISIESSLSLKDYVVTASVQNEISVQSGNSKYLFLGSSTSSEYLNPVTAAQLQVAQKRGETSSYLLAAADTSNPVVFMGLFAMLALDPTGILLRLCQILKIVNKLYFININYGQKLDAFLSRLGGLISIKLTTAEDEALHTKHYRGKLSKKHVAVDFVEKNLVHLIFYLTSWALVVLAKSIIQLRLKLNKALLCVIYYIPKVHLIIFNLVFIDFIWMTSRFSLHSRG